MALASSGRSPGWTETTYSPAATSRHSFPSSFEAMTTGWYFHDTLPVIRPQTWRSLQPKAYSTVSPDMANAWHQLKRRA
jgi:hypothetical protein